MKCKDCDYSCGRRGKGETECFYEVEMKMQKEAEEAPYWRNFRAEAAKDILCATLSGGIASGATGLMEEKGNIVEASIEIADELIKQLKEKEQG